MVYDIVWYIVWCIPVLTSSFLLLSFTRNPVLLSQPVHVGGWPRVGFCSHRERAAVLEDAITS